MTLRLPVIKHKFRKCKASHYEGVLTTLDVKYDYFVYCNTNGLNFLNEILAFLIFVDKVIQYLGQNILHTAKGLKYFYCACITFPCSLFNKGSNASVQGSNAYLKCFKDH